MHESVPNDRRFGASLTGSAASVLMSLSDSQRSVVLHKLFNPASGAGISLIRVSMGANDFSPQGDFTYDDPPSSDSAKQKKAYTDTQLKKI